MLGISRIPPAQATSEGGDSCMNALKVIHGFALIIGPCNISFRGLAPLLYHNSPHITNRRQESRSIDVGMKNMNCIPEQNIIVSLLSIYLSYTLFTKYQSRIHR